MSAFTYRTGPARIEFGRGGFANLSSVLEDLGCNRALVVSTAFQKPLAVTTAEILGDKSIGIFDGAAMHTPIQVTETAMLQVKSLEADCIVAVGGGSTTGLGKAIAYRTGLPNIVVPTTYAGSEVTPILGQTEDGLKTTINDPRVLPTVVIYDPELTHSLPQNMTVVSGLNAMAHAAEALYAKDRNPISTMLAVEGFAAMKRGLGLLSNDLQSHEGRDAALFGTWLCGTVLGQVGMALHHKICHTLGGSFDMPHAETHAVMLPHTIAFNAVSVPDLMQPIADVFDAAPGQGLFDFAVKIGAPTSLNELGFKAADLDKAAGIATRDPYWNPRTIDEAGLRAMLQGAFDGTPPA